MLLCILSLKVTKHADVSSREAALLGVCWGVLLLLTPPIAILFPAWMAIGFLGRDIEGRRRYLRFTGIATASLLLTLAPWTIRNLLVFGKPIWGRGNLGLELQVSNNECAAADFLDMVRAGCHARMNPNVNPEVASQMLAAGEANYQ